VQLQVAVALAFVPQLLAQECFMLAVVVVL
jgi:hypothetical protein